LIPGKFEMEESATGLAIRATRDPLITDCLAPREVETQIEALKRELDWLALRMKRRIEQRKTEDIV